MARYNVKDIIWEKVEVLGRKGLFTELRIDRDSIPDGCHMYEVRHDDNCQGNPVQIARWVMVNHLGTLLVKEPFDLEPSKVNNNAYLDIDPDKDWDYLDECVRF